VKKITHYKAVCDLLEAIEVGYPGRSTAPRHGAGIAAQLGQSVRGPLRVVGRVSSASP
jgi:hypothetical protein